MVVKSKDKQSNGVGETSVIELTSNTFFELVTSSNLNSFILFYSPNCRHCQKFKPTWLELAEMLKNENVNIMQMDVLNNKWPNYLYPVAKYPTMYWRYADKRPPLKYIGHRTIKDLMKFVANQMDLNEFDRNGNPKPKKIQ